MKLDETENVVTSRGKPARLSTLAPTHQKGLLRFLPKSLAVAGLLHLPCGLFLLLLDLADRRGGSRWLQHRCGFLHLRITGKFGFSHDREQLLRNDNSSFFASRTCEMLVNLPN